jgi:hypothetical protein
MLSCLVTVPLIAMFGTSLPEETPREVATTRSASPGPKSEADPPRAEVIPASYQTSGQWEDQRGAPSPGEPGPPMVADDRLATVQRHLQQLGATYYRLESWGNEGPRFRFECRVAFGRNSDCARHFEATNRDAMQAIAKVVRQVEAWVAAQRTRTGG